MAPNASAGIGSKRTAHQARQAMLPRMPFGSCRVGTCLAKLGKHGRTCAALTPVRRFEWRILRR